MLVASLGPLIKLLQAPSPVVHSYAALCLERILTVKSASAGGLLVYVNGFLNHGICHHFLWLPSRVGHCILQMWFLSSLFFLLSFFFLACSQQSQIGCLHTSAHGETIIFLPCYFFLSIYLLFFPRLISAAVGWMSTIL